MLLYPVLLVLTFGNTISFATDVTEYAGNKTSSPGASVANVTYETSTNGCVSSRSCDSCGGAVAGAVVASLIVGLMVGATTMYFAPRYWKRRKMNVPPKDYTSTQSSALDVNMNNGERTEEDAQDDAPTPADPPVKSHKKLERLSNQGPKPSIGPKPVLGFKGKPNICSSVETPLIFTGSKTDRVISSNQAPSFNNSDQQQLQKKDNPSGEDGGGSGDDGENGDGGLENIYQDVDYTNIGLDAALSQPYDALDSIPEEVEYANTQEYEQLGLVSNS